MNLVYFTLDNICITNCLSGSVAEAAGLLANDQINVLNGKAVHKVNCDTVAEIIRYALLISQTKYANTFPIKIVYF